MLLPIRAYVCVVRFLTSVHYFMILRVFKYVLKCFLNPKEW